MPFWAAAAPLIGAGLKAAAPAIASWGISKLFGNDEKQETSGTAPGVDYKQLVEDAEKAGFNPLTVLRAGGGAGYQRTHNPVFASAAALNQAEVGNIATSFIQGITSYAPRDMELERIERELMVSQISRIQAETKQINHSMTQIPQSTGSATKIAGAALAAGGPYEAGQVSVTNGWVGEGLVIDPRVADAEAQATRYGDSEIAQMLFGANVAYHDMNANGGPIEIAKKLNGGSPISIRENSVADWWAKNWDKPLFPEWGWGGFKNTPRPEGYDRTKNYKVYSW